MMKSFFKKLAFVMALAMVVSMVAPAGAVFAAEAGITIQGTKTVVTEYTFEEVDKTFDFAFEGAPSDWKSTYKWSSSNEDVATVDTKGVVTAVAPGTAVITLTAGADKSYVHTVTVTVKSAVEEMVPVQKTASKVEVTFTANHSFDATGTDANENTVKLYRVFSTEEMAKMTSTNGFAFDAEGNGYQAHYIMSATGKDNVWTLQGYTYFVDGAKYAVVYGPNETSSTIEGIKAFFTAYVGKVHHIEISATDATVENEIEPAVPAKLTTKLFNEHNVDLTDYYKNADETDYELVTEDIDVSISGDEVTFDEAGAALVKGTYTFYDEDLEEDVVCPAEVLVYGRPYSTYRVDSIYAWTLKNDKGEVKFATPTTSMIAGDANQLYVIVKDNRDNYYTNYAGIGDFKVGDTPVVYVGDGAEDTAFEQYGYELVFDSLDPDSLLVDVDGAVESYKKTNSFAVVSYTNINDENRTLREIGVMAIKVTEPRVLKSLNYKNGTSFTVLKETEAEDGLGIGEGGYYNKPEYADDFKLTATLQIDLKNQYGALWGDNAEDWGEAEPFFTVTTSKDELTTVASLIADSLNDQVAAGGVELTYPISYFDIFAGTTTTSVTFKIKEAATGDSETITIKLNEPKYVLDGNGEETTLVYVDPTRAILDVAAVELYTGLDTTAKLFQVSKANQKIGYFRTGTAENADEVIDGVGRSYFVANKLTNQFVVDNGEAADFVTLATGAALKKNDYVLVVTDPSGKIFPMVGEGGNGKSFGKDSNLGLVDNGTGYEIVLAAANADGELEYAATGTYRATVYKITSIVPGTTTTKYNVSRVASDSFVVTKTFKEVSFFHQETTKDANVTFDAAAGEDNAANYANIVEAISETMTFRIAGQDINLVAGADTYKDYLTGDEIVCNLEIVDVDYKIQADNSRAVVNTVTFKVYTPAGEYTEGEDAFYFSKVKVNRSVNAAQ